MPANRRRNLSTLHTTRFKCCAKSFLPHCAQAMIEASIRRTERRTGNDDTPAVVPRFFTPLTVRNPPYKNFVGTNKRRLPKNTAPDHLQTPAEPQQPVSLPQSAPAIGQETQPNRFTAPQPAQWQQFLQSPLTPYWAAPHQIFV